MTYYEIINIINQRLKQTGKDKTEFAKEVGIHRNTLNNWLNYNYRMPMDYAMVILHKLGLDVQLVKMEEKK